MGVPARKTLAANLVALMASEKHQHLRTIKMLSDASGVSTGTIDRMRRAEVNTGVDWLDALAKAFKVPAWELLEPNQREGMPFRDLNNFETQLITFFRQLTADQQHELLTGLNDMVPKAGTPSRADPYGKGQVRGMSRLGELDAIPPVAAKKTPRHG